MPGNLEVPGSIPARVVSWCLVNLNGIYDQYLVEEIENLLQW